jgi:hypothetical protein
VVDRWEAELIAAPWVNQDVSVGVARDYEVHDFDLGYVFSRVLPMGMAEDVGSGRIVIDKENGELTYWPSSPIPEVVEQYRAFRMETPAAPLSWDPVVRARHDRIRASFPVDVTHLGLRRGRMRMAQTMKGDGIPNLHRLVREFLDDLPVRYRERGNDRCAEVAALSDALHAEDARRALSGEPPITLDDARTGLLSGADLVTYRVREPGDPTGGQPTSPCVSCQALLLHLGFALQPPSEDGE